MTLFMSLIYRLCGSFHECLFYNVGLDLKHILNRRMQIQVLCKLKKINEYGTSPT